METTTRVKDCETLAFPAHLWLWIVARLCRDSFSCGPVNQEGDSV